MGAWTKESGDINDRPIYKRTSNYGDYYMAVKTVQSGYIPSWVGGVGTPGSNQGMMFGQSRAPKCPHGVSAWTYYSQNSGTIEEDESLKVTCGARECPRCQ